MSKEAFKTFVRANPSLIKYVNNDTMTWQKFYDMFELYGTNHNAWKDFLSADEFVVGSGLTGGLEGTLKELFNTVRGINLEKVQKGINSLQKTISLVQDFNTGNRTTDQYEKRPVYKHFDD